MSLSLFLSFNKLKPPLAAPWHRSHEGTAALVFSTACSLRRCGSRQPAGLVQVLQATSQFFWWCSSITMRRKLALIINKHTFHSWSKLTSKQEWIEITLDRAAATDRNQSHSNWRAGAESSRAQPPEPSPHGRSCWETRPGIPTKHPGRAARCIFQFCSPFMLFYLTELKYALFLSSRPR